MRSRNHRYARRAASAAIILCLSVAASAQTQDPAPTPTSPLAIHVGDADLLIGGFIDATSIRRSTNTGSGLGTSFGTIPFANTPQGGTLMYFLIREQPERSH